VDPKDCFTDSDPEIFLPDSDSDSDSKNTGTILT
jgi:hypothetical protein